MVGSPAPEHPRSEARSLRAAAAACAATAATAYLLSVLAHARWPSVFVGWVLLVPWLAVLDRTRTLGRAAGAGILMSVASVTALFPWFPRMVADYTGASWWVGAIAMIVLAPALEPQFVTFAIVRRLADSPSYPSEWWRTALVGAGVYVGTEWVFPKLLDDTLGYGLHASREMRQAADVFGADGLTFTLVLGNECIFSLLRARGRTRSALTSAACLVAITTGLATYGAFRLARLAEIPNEAPMTAAIVQGNLAHYDEMRASIGSFEAVRRILDTYFALSSEALSRRPGFLIWPETVYPTTFGTPKTAEGADFDESIMRFAADGGVPLLFGAYAAEGTQEFNAAVLLQHGGKGSMVVDAYRKSRLFPFTESLPRPLASEPVRRLVPWAGAWTPGSGPRVLVADVGGRLTRFAPLICYDALDTDFVVGAVRQDAELLVTLSNDSWFAFPDIQRLIMILSAFRSIETRRPQLRATPTGVSAVIDESGDVVDRVDENQRGVLFATVRPARGTWTLVLAWGNWLPPTALVVSLLLLAVAYARRQTKSTRAAG